MGFDFRTGQIGTVSPTVCHRCDVSSELCSPGAKPRRWAPPLVTLFDFAPPRNRYGTPGLESQLYENASNYSLICIALQTLRNRWKIQLVSVFTDTVHQRYSSDGRVVRSSASVAVDSGLIPSRVKPMTLKLVFTASLLDARDSMKNKPTSSLVVPLGKALSGITPSWCGRQMTGNFLASSYSALLTFWR